MTDSGTNNYIDPKAPVFTIVGTGGVNLYSLTWQGPYIAEQSRAFAMFLMILFYLILKTGRQITNYLPAPSGLHSQYQWPDGSAVYNPGSMTSIIAL